jgi:hypothetical protein
MVKLLQSDFYFVASFKFWLRMTDVHAARARREAHPPTFTDKAELSLLAHATTPLLPRPLLDGLHRLI